MKKFIFTLLAVLTLGISAQGQSTFNKGTAILNFGLGIGGDLFNDSYRVLCPPLSVSLDYSVVGNLFDGNGSIGLGGYAASSLYKTRHHEYTNATYSHTLIGPRASLHYQFVDRLDTYISLLLGLSIEHINSSGNSHSDATFGMGLHVGTRYYLSNDWAIMGEVGYGLTYLMIGATYRF